MLSTRVDGACSARGDQGAPNTIRGGFREALAQLALYLFAISAGFCLFVLGFRSGVLSGISILFYRGLALIPTTAAVQAIVLILVLRWARRRRILPWFGRTYTLIMVLVSATLNFSLFVLVPVNVDRSISVFLLTWMDERQGVPNTQADLEHAFRDIYIKRYGAIDRRIVEQIATGNIECTSKGLQLTAQGRVIVEVFRLVGDLFSTDHRLLYSESHMEKTLTDRNTVAHP